MMLIFLLTGKVSALEPELVMARNKNDLKSIN